jgi:drug/metabolite transporter (DMT)-like permease
MRTRAVLYALLAALSLSAMTFFAKKVVVHYDSAAIIFWRFVVSLAYSSVIYKMNPLSFLSRDFIDQQWKMHLIRALSTIAAMWCLAAALKTIAPVTVNTLNLTHPLFLLLLLLALGRNRFSIYSFGACLAGFMGIYFVLSPSFLTPDYSGYVLAVMSGFFTALSYLIINSMSVEKSSKELLYFNSLICAVICAVILALSSTSFYRGGDGFATLMVSCLFGSLYQDFIIRALGLAQPSVPSSLMYSSVLFSALLSFNQLSLDFSFFAGIALITLSGIMVSFRKV